MVLDISVPRLLPRANRLRRIAAGAVDLAFALSLASTSLLFPAQLHTFVASERLLKLLFLAPSAYLLGRDAIGGRSLGKRIFGLVAVDLGTRRPAGVVESVLRNWPLSLVPVPFVGPVVTGSFVVLTGAQILFGFRFRLGDGSATTQVVEMTAMEWTGEVLA